MAKSRARVPLCFDLIKSLDTAEKIHFKRHLPHQSGKNDHIYVRLFDELDKMKEYDAERLKRKFKGEKFTKHLSASFKQLYDSLLISLVNYHTKKDDELIADEMIGEIKILLQKRLYKQCARQIKRARKFFEEREYHRHLYVLGAYEYNLIARQIQQDEITKLKRVTEERRAYLKKLDDELLILDLCQQIARYHREKQLNPNRGFTEEIADLSPQLKELKGKFEVGSMTFKRSFTRATEYLYYIENQLIKSLEASHRYVRLRRNLPETLRYSHGADLDAMNNHIIKSIEMWFVDEIEYWLPKLQNVVYYCILLLEDLALYHFLTSNFQESLEWINRIFEQKDIDKSLRKYIINMRLIEIMVHFNLGNYQLVLSCCRSFLHSVKTIQHTDNEFAEEKKWVKSMMRLQSYILPKQLNDFIETLLPKSYFALPPNYRLVLMSVWSQAHHNNISLRESWVQHAENIIAEMKATTGMDVLRFGEIEGETPDE